MVPRLNNAVSKTVFPHVHRTLLRKKFTTVTTRTIRVSQHEVLWSRGTSNIHGKRHNPWTNAWDPRTGKAGKDGSGWMTSQIGLRQSCLEWCTWQKIERSSECSFMVSSKLHTEYDTHHATVRKVSASESDRIKVTHRRCSHWCHSKWPYMIFC